MLIFRVFPDASLVDEDTEGSFSRVQEGTVTITVFEVVVATQASVRSFYYTAFRLVSNSSQTGALVSTKINSLREYADALESGDVCDTFTGRFPAFVYVLS